MRFIDTHAHYFDPKFDSLAGGAQGVLDDPAFRASVLAVINIGTNLQNSRAAVEQAAKYPFMAAAVGIHPEDCQVYPDESGSTGGRQPLDPETELPRLRAWLTDPAVRRRDKIVAIGEIGLDHHWQPVDAERQSAFFDGQLALAEELNLPVIIHDREAHGACFDAVCRHAGVRGVFHGYSGSAEMAKELVRRGFYIAFGGSLTFRNADRLRAVAASVPPERLLLETDCPYMAPVPLRGTVNRSDTIIHIARVLASLHGMTPEELADVTSRNAVRLFDLDSVLPFYMICTNSLSDFLHAAYKESIF